MYIYVQLNEPRWVYICIHVAGTFHLTCAVCIFRS